MPQRQNHQNRVGALHSSVLSQNDPSPWHQRRPAKFTAPDIRITQGHSCWTKNLCRAGCARAHLGRTRSTSRPPNRYGRKSTRASTPGPTLKNRKQGLVSWLLCFFASLLFWLLSSRLLGFLAFVTGSFAFVVSWQCAATIAQTQVKIKVMQNTSKIRHENAANTVPIRDSSFNMLQASCQCASIRGGASFSNFRHKNESWRLGPNKTDTNNHFLILRFGATILIYLGIVGRTWPKRRHEDMDRYLPG